MAPKAAAICGVAFRLGLFQAPSRRPSVRLPRGSAGARTSACRSRSLRRPREPRANRSSRLRRRDRKSRAAAFLPASVRSSTSARPCRPGCRPAERRCRCGRCRPSSRLRRAFSLTLGMSRVNSSRPSLVSRISMSNSSMCSEVYVSSFTRSSLMMIASSKLKPSQAMKPTSTLRPRANSPRNVAAPSAMHFALLDLLAELDDRLLVLAGPLVEPDELAQRVDFGADFDAVGIDVGNGPLLAGPHDHARVLGDVALHAGGHDRRFGDQQRHGLPLHVRAHQGAVGVVVLQERDQAGRNADHLARRDVHVLDLVDRHQLEVGRDSGQ